MMLHPNPYIKFKSSIPKRWQFDLPSHILYHRHNIFVLGPMGCGACSESKRFWWRARIQNKIMQEAQLLHFVEYMKCRVHAAALIIEELRKLEYAV